MGSSPPAGSDPLVLAGSGNELGIRGSLFPKIEVPAVVVRNEVREPNSTTTRGLLAE